MWQRYKYHPRIVFYPFIWVGKLTDKVSVCRIIAIFAPK
nr:MAG TPA: hypothetical protein [Caudoviricetes sp.]DAP90467.1 MAG TPA: hypothetical protein [Caudoviricetes sp.]DAP95289.1 MAG TPA: hypothetical protein [Caudoviricetes sp.]